MQIYGCFRSCFYITTPFFGKIFEQFNCCIRFREKNTCSSNFSPLNKSLLHPYWQDQHSTFSFRFNLGLPRERKKTKKQVCYTLIGKINIQPSALENLGLPRERKKTKKYMFIFLRALIADKHIGWNHKKSLPLSLGQVCKIKPEI